MPHAARHSRPHARRQDEAHALGSLLDTLHSPSDLAPPATAHRCSSQPQNTAPPSPSPTTSSRRIHAASVELLSEDEELSRRQHTEQQATASARTADQPHPPPEPQPATPPAGAGAGAGYMSDDAASNQRTLRDIMEADIMDADITEELAMDLLSHLFMMQNAVLQKLKNAKAQRNAIDGYNAGHRIFKGNGRSNGFAHLRFSNGGRGRASTTMNFNR